MDAYHITQEDARMSFKEQMKTGKVYIEFGHA